MLKKLFKYGVVLFLLGIVGIVLFIMAVNYNVFGHLYTQQEIQNFSNENASLVYSEDEILLGKFFAENRTNISYSQIPEELINALVATEDARYFEHEGIDSQSLLRVLFKSILLNNKSAGGGSTITQQLAKNMYGRKDFGFLTMPVNKTKEALLATRIEKLYNKEEILTLYLNTVPFGENVYGIEAASKRFFNKRVHQLKLEESAVLVGMLKANTGYNPRLYPENALQRRNVVLGQMEKYGYLSKEDTKKAQNKPLVLDYANLTSEGVANYFLVHVKNQSQKIIEEYNKANGTQYNLLTDGLVINTTLNYKMQTYALSALKRHLTVKQKTLRKQYTYGKYKHYVNKKANQIIDKKGFDNTIYKKRSLFYWSKNHQDSITVKDSIIHDLTQLHAGVMAMNPYNGKIKIWVGGINQRFYPYDQVYAKRQMASTFKPILYAAALEQGFSPCTYLDNDEIVLTDFDHWSPSNYDHTTGGKYSLQGALMKSKNIPTVNLYFQVGYDNLNYLWKKLGFSETLQNKPSTALGTNNASIYETTIAYASFANGGFLVEPKSIISIKTQDGKVLYQDQSKSIKGRVLDETTSHFIASILQSAVDRGTGAALHGTYGVSNKVSGKTGTSQDYSDAWFASFTANFVMVTRVGANTPSVHFSSGSQGSGSKLALPIAAITLHKIEANKTLKRDVFKNFSPLSEWELEQMDCDDFKEDNLIDNILDPFKSKETTIKKKERKQRKPRAKPKKKEGLFKRLFGKKKNN